MLYVCCMFVVGAARIKQQHKKAGLEIAKIFILLLYYHGDMYGV